MHEVLVPAILATTEANFCARIARTDLWTFTPTIQIDVLDHSMFDAESIFDPSLYPTPYSLYPHIELHLMVQNPLPIINAWKMSGAPVKRAIVHAEIDRPLKPIIDQIHKLNLEAEIALNPETDVSDFSHEIQEADGIMIMGVHPGTSGQLFLGDTILQKIAETRERFSHHQISVDGGVREETVHAMLDAGADRLAASSMIWKSDHAADLLKRYNR
ncbi:MAG: hypothetical protein O3B64_02930 [bacterium]|nr:hypothetical protein [bacterium]MDA1024577.1 hypothetical protein [bacterium]